MRAIAFTLLILAACRGGATKVRYAGPPVGRCDSGRTYVPVAAPAPAPAAEVASHE